MRKYDGDWGTRQVMKTCCKYYMNAAIQAKKREPRNNYLHTAKNSAKRDPNGPRGPKYGQAASRRAQVGNHDSMDPATNLDPLPPSNGAVDYLRPTIEPIIHSQTSQPHVASHWDGQSSFSNVNQAHYEQCRLPRPCPDWQPLAGPSQQHIQNPAFMENMYQFKLDRTPSPFPHANHASGSNSRYDPRCD